MQAWEISTGEYSDKHVHFVVLGDESLASDWVMRYNAAGAGNWITCAGNRATYDELSIVTADNLPDPNTKL